MTINEAIKDLETSAESAKREGFNVNTTANAQTPRGKSCYEYARACQQMAEWLKELKVLREVVANITRAADAPDVIVRHYGDKVW